MPLLDHFHAPLSLDHGWESFHGSWPTMITQHLNHGGLPPGYFAAPLAKLGGPVEVDMGAFERVGGGTAGNGGVATAVYAPPRPRIARPATFPDADLFEVQVMRREGRARLVAAIELVSPTNKDRPGNRRTFVVKCASYLRQGVSVIIVDVVTERSGNLHAELLEFLGAGTDSRAGGPEQLYAAAYRAVPVSEQPGLEAWPETLALGSDLPTLPLWLAADLSVPLPLEQTYLATCDLLLLP